MTRLPAAGLNWLLALLSAVLLVVIFPRLNLVWLAPFALTPLLLALAREPRPLHRFLLGWTAGLVYWFATCHWIQFVLEVHGGMGRWGGWGTFLLFSVLKAIHLGIFAMLAAIVLPKWYAIPAVAALWTGIERTHSPAGFVWLDLGNAGIDMPLAMRLAPVVGVYGLSFIFVMTATAAALVIRRRSRRELAWLLAIPALLALPRLPEPRAGVESAVLVQPNVPEEGEWSPVTAEILQRHMVDLTAAPALAAPTFLIAWPEAPGPFYYYEDPGFREKLQNLARLTQSWFIIGTVAENLRHEPLNSAVMLAPDGRLVDRYDKNLLVPFGEFVPPLFSFVNRVTKEAGDFAPGTRTVVFPAGPHRVGVFICYESAFPHYVREFARNGADVLVNISNDGYFGHSIAREQHLLLVRMRAAENRRWILRATNDGFTVSVDPSGRVIKRLPPYIETAGRFQWSGVSETTPYTHYGDWFAWSCLAAGIASLFLSQIPHYEPPAKPVGRT